MLEKKVIITGNLHTEVPNCRNLVPNSLIEVFLIYLRVFQFFFCISRADYLT